MILIRKNEVDTNILNVIMKKKQVYHYNFDILFQGEIWTDIRMSSLFESVDSDMEEYGILKSFFHSDKIDIDNDTRSFLYMIASLKKYSIGKNTVGLNLLSMYMLSNVTDAKELNLFENEFWDIGVANEIPKIDPRIATALIIDLVLKKADKVKLNSNSVSCLSYHRKNLSYQKLRERYFLIKNKSKLKDVLYDKTFDEKEMSMPEDKSNLYVLKNFTSLKTIREKLPYVPNDIFCFFIDSLVEKKICLPVLDNLVYLKNSKYKFYDLINGPDRNFVNDMKKIYNEIYSQSSIMHKCDSKELKVIFRRISNGKI